jgi:hypothetical protein
VQEIVGVVAGAAIGAAIGSVGTGHSRGYVGRGGNVRATRTGPTHTTTRISSGSGRNNPTGTTTTRATNTSSGNAIGTIKQPNGQVDQIYSTPCKPYQVSGTSWGCAH